MKDYVKRVSELTALPAPGGHRIILFLADGRWGIGTSELDAFEHALAQPLSQVRRES